MFASIYRQNRVRDRALQQSAAALSTLTPDSSRLTVRIHLKCPGCSTASTCIYLLRHFVAVTLLLCPSIPTNLCNSVL